MACDRTLEFSLQKNMYVMHKDSSINQSVIEIFFANGQCLKNLVCSGLLIVTLLFIVNLNKNLRVNNKIQKSVPALLGGIGSIS